MSIRIHAAAAVAAATVAVAAAIILIMPSAFAHGMSSPTGVATSAAPQ